MPDQNRVLEGLRREDLFTVVYEQAFTDTRATPACCSGDDLLGTATSRVTTVDRPPARPP
jgi:hypothetical protein